MTKILSLNANSTLLINNSHKMKSKYLITSLIGTWTTVTELQYKKIQQNKLSKAFYEKLEKRLIIQTEKNKKLIQKLYSARLNLIKLPPALHIIVLTNNCNFACSYCQVSAKKPADKGSMNTETAKKTVDFILATPSNRIIIEFQGGEGLLNFKVLKHIVEYAQEKNLKLKKDLSFTLVTNFSLINNDNLKYILKNKIRLSTSIDGPKQVHDHNRKLLGGQGTYDQIAPTIKLLNEKNMNIGLLNVITKYSLNFPKEIIDEYVGFKEKELYLKPLTYLGFAKEKWVEIGYTMDEFLEFWDKSLDYIFKLNKKGIIIRERMVKLALQKIIGPYDPGYTDWRSPCGFLLGQVAYDINGNIYGCDEARNFPELKLGEVGSNSFPEIINNPLSKQFIEASMTENYLCDNCAYKPYCGLCPVVNYSQFKTPVSCLPNNDLCKFHKHIFDFVFNILINKPAKRKLLLGWLKQ